MATSRGAGAALLTVGLTLGLTACGGSQHDPAGLPVPAFGTAAPTAGVAPAGAGTGAAAPAAPDAAPGAGSGTKVVPGSSLYVVLNLRGWELDQAVRPIGRSRAQEQKDDSSLDWSATYDQPDQDQSLILNGHLRGLAGQTAVLRKQGGGTVQTGDVNGRPAAWVDQSGGNVVVLIALSPNYTIELTTEGIDLATTLTIAKALSPVDETAWKAAGGKVIDCLATDECVS